MEINTQNNSENTQNEQNEQEAEEAEEALNAYYQKMKQYKDDIKNQKVNFIQDKKFRQLSTKEKRKEYAKLRKKIKCVYCGNPGGTIFETQVVPDDIYRIMSAKCNAINKCKVDIKIKVYDSYDIRDFMKESQQSIDENQNRIIDYKNQLLFGCVKIDIINKVFTQIQTQIHDDIMTYETARDQYTNITEERHQIMSQYKTQLQNYINDMSILPIKDKIELYIDRIIPLINNIRKEKYVNKPTILVNVKQCIAKQLIEKDKQYINEDIAEVITFIV
jgi:hypothetical protein